MPTQNSLKDTVACTLHDPERWDEDGGCSMGMIFQMCRSSGQNSMQVIIDLITEGRAYVVEPLALTSFDSLVCPLTWEVGTTTNSDIVAQFGQPHRVKDRTFVYDIYVEEVEEGYPSPPSPYLDRNLAEPDRPPTCDFPYAGIWPPEALQVHFIFDVGGTLQGHRFCVEERIR
jgi:hypothetical protein